MPTSKKHILWVSSGLILFLLSLPSSVQADYYTGSLSYGNGLEAVGSWANPLTSISWIVTNEDPGPAGDFVWKYVYTLTVPKKDISHFIIEASNGEDPFTVENIIGLTGAKSYEVGLYANDASNPSMPGDLYGLKIDDLSTTNITVTVFSDRAPVWGDMYAKGGKEKGVWMVLYNTGFSEVDPVDPPAGGSISGHLLRPDTVDSIPEPSVLLLLAAGGLGALRRGSR